MASSMKDTLQLVSFSDSKIVLNEDALEMVSRLPSESGIPVISMTGMRFTGKSHFLNEMFNLGRNGFPVSQDEDVPKKEISMKVASHDKQRVILLDCPGIPWEAVNADDVCQAFLFILLISSMILFNSKVIRSRATKAIGNELLRQLHFLSPLVGLSRTQPNLASSLVWIIRDMQPPFTSEIRPFKNASLYLEAQLEEAGDPQSDAERQANSVRAAIKTLLPNRRCTTLKSNSIREEFSRDVANLKTELMSGIRPKVINGEVLSGTQLARLMRAVANFINNEPGTTIESVFELAFREPLSVSDIQSDSGPSRDVARLEPVPEEGSYEGDESDWSEDRDWSEGARQDVVRGESPSAGGPLVDLPVPEEGSQYFGSEERDGSDDISSVMELRQDADQSENQPARNPLSCLPEPPPGMVWRRAPPYAFLSHVKEIKQVLSEAQDGNFVQDGNNLMPSICKGIVTGLAEERRAPVLVPLARRMQHAITAVLEARAQIIGVAAGPSDQVPLAVPSSSMDLPDVSQGLGVAVVVAAGPVPLTVPSTLMDSIQGSQGHGVEDDIEGLPMDPSVQVPLAVPSSSMDFPDVIQGLGVTVAVAAGPVPLAVPSTLMDSIQGNQGHGVEDDIEGLPMDSDGPNSVAQGAAGPSSIDVLSEVRAGTKRLTESESDILQPPIKREKVADDSTCTATPTDAIPDLDQVVPDLILVQLPDSLSFDEGQVEDYVSDNVSDMSVENTVDSEDLVPSTMEQASQADGLAHIANLASMAGILDRLKARASASSTPCASPPSYAGSPLPSPPPALDLRSCDQSPKVLKPCTDEAHLHVQEQLADGPDGDRLELDTLTSPPTDLSECHMDAQSSAVPAACLNHSTENVIPNLRGDLADDMLTRSGFSPEDLCVIGDAASPAAPCEDVGGLAVGDEMPFCSAGPVLVAPEETVRDRLLVGSLSPQTVLGIDGDNDDCSEKMTLTVETPSDQKRDLGDGAAPFRANTDIDDHAVRDALLEETVQMPVRASAVGTGDDMEQPVVWGMGDGILKRRRPAPRVLTLDTACELSLDGSPRSSGDLRAAALRLSLDPVRSSGDLRAAALRNSVDPLRSSGDLRCASLRSSQETVLAAAVRTSRDLGSAARSLPSGMASPRLPDSDVMSRESPRHLDQPRSPAPALDPVEPSSSLSSLDGGYPCSPVQFPVPMSAVRHPPQSVLASTPCRENEQENLEHSSESGKSSVDTSQQVPDASAVSYASAVSGSLQDQTDVLAAVLSPAARQPCAAPSPSARPGPSSTRQSTRASARSSANSKASPSTARTQQIVSSPTEGQTRQDAPNRLVRSARARGDINLSGQVKSSAARAESSRSASKSAQAGSAQGGSVQSTTALPAIPLLASSTANSVTQQLVDTPQYMRPTLSCSTSARRFSVSSPSTPPCDLGSRAQSQSAIQHRAKRRMPSSSSSTAPSSPALSSPLPKAQTTPQPSSSRVTSQRLRASESVTGTDSPARSSPSRTSQDSLLDTPTVPSYLRPTRSSANMSRVQAAPVNVRNTRTQLRAGPAPAPAPAASNRSVSPSQGLRVQPIPVSQPTSSSVASATITSVSAAQPRRGEQSTESEHAGDAVPRCSTPPLPHELVQVVSTPVQVNGDVNEDPTVSAQSPATASTAPGNHHSVEQAGLAGDDAAETKPEPTKDADRQRPDATAAVGRLRSASSAGPVLIRFVPDDDDEDRRFSAAEQRDGILNLIPRRRKIDETSFTKFWNRAAASLNRFCLSCFGVQRESFD